LRFSFVLLLGDFGFSFFAAEFHAVFEFVDGSANSALTPCFGASSHFSVA
jgi:hypothetical protein